MIKMRLVRLLSHAKKYIVFHVIWQWIALLAQIFSVFSIGRLLEHVMLKTAEATMIVTTVGILAGAAAVRFFCDQMAAQASFSASVDVKRILRDKIYEKLLCLGVPYREKVSTSQVVQMCAEGVEQLEIYFGKYLPQLFYSILAPITLFVILSFVSWKASIVLLICVPLIPLSIVAVQKIAKKLLSRYWGMYTKLGDSFLENLQGMTALKIYEADEQKALEMDEEASNFRKITMKVLSMQLNSTSVMDLIAYGGAAIGMMVAVNEFSHGQLSLQGALIIVLLSSEFFIPLRLLGSFFHIAMNGMAASDKIFRLLDLEEPLKGTVEQWEKDAVIQFSNVHFSYEKERKILQNISLDFPAGGFISLVGESGSGKSTIAGILMGKNRNYQGDVRIGTVPLSKIQESKLMEQITFIGHNSYLFKGTVEENLRMAKLNASKEEMNAVLEKVNLLGFLDSQKGLSTKLMERAENFSGGQRQRLALARALLHDTPVYIFDEATSNIDVESEELIMNVIHELAQSKTVLLISHRLANVVDSDCIYVLSGGQIEECGTHQQLIKQKGHYCHLFQRQRELEQYAEGVTENSMKNTKFIQQSIQRKVVKA